MPDEDEDPFDTPGIDDLLLVETLMGWDGDFCLCTECVCQRFRDDAPDGLCDPCRAGDHSA